MELQTGCPVHSRSCCAQHAGAMAAGPPCHCQAGDPQSVLYSGGKVMVLLLGKREAASLHAHLSELCMATVFPHPSIFWLLKSL